MIKYFCDFCKEEMEISIAKPDVEVSITLTKVINTSNRTTQRAEHICLKCNELLITNLTGLGLGVDVNGTEA